MTLHSPQEALPTIPIGLEEIVQASKRLEPWVHRTPVMTSKTLDARSGATVFLKCENFQRVGAFKFRGAMNALLQLDDAAKGGRRRDAFLGQSCAGTGAGGPVAGRAGNHRDAPHGSGGQARRPKAMERASCSASRRSKVERRPWPRRSTPTG